MKSKIFNEQNKIRISLFPVLISCLSLLIISACTSTQPSATASKKEVLSTPQDPDAPCWVKDVSCKDTATELAVRGGSKRFKDMQGAERDAIRDAQIRAVEVVEVNLERIDDEVASILGRANKALPRGIAQDDATKRIMNKKLNGMRPVNYTRRWSITEHGDTEEEWESFALILLPRDLNTVVAKEVLDEKEALTKDPLIDRASKRLDELREQGWGKMNR